MAHTPKQRFVALRVHEVSLVDRPANEEEFLVVKRHPLTDVEKNQMANKAAQTAEHQKDGKEAGKNMADVEKKKKLPPALDESGKGKDAPNDEDMEAKEKAAGQDSKQGDDAAALKKPELPSGGDRSKAPTKPKDGQGYSAESDLTKGKAKKDGDGDEDEGEKDGDSAGKDKGDSDKGKKDDGSEDGEEGDAEKSKSKKPDAKDEKDAEEMMASCKAMMSKIDSFFDGWDKKADAGAGGAPYKATKSVGEKKVQKGAVDEVIMGMLYKLQDQLYKLTQMQSLDMSDDVEKSAHKGAKHMTPTRMEKLKNLHGGLVELMKELQPPEDPTAGVTPIYPTTLEGKSAPLENGNGYKGETGLTKALQEALAPITEQIAGVAKRLEKVENVKGVSKAVTEDETVKPVEKNNGFWSGVL